MQPEKLDELRVWILRARHDLLAAERLGAGVDGLPDVSTPSGAPAVSPPR